MVDLWVLLWLEFQRKYQGWSALPGLIWRKHWSWNILKAKCSKLRTLTMWYAFFTLLLQNDKTVCIPCSPFLNMRFYDLFFSGKRLFIPFPTVLFIPCTSWVHPQPDWSIHHETRWGDFAATVCWLFLFFFSFFIITVVLYFYIAFCVFFSCLLSFCMRFDHLA